MIKEINVNRPYPYCGKVSKTLNQRNQTGDQSTMISTYVQGVCECRNDVQTIHGFLISAFCFCFKM